MSRVAQQQRYSGRRPLAPFAVSGWAEWRGGGGWRGSAAAAQGGGGGGFGHGLVLAPGCPHARAHTTQTCGASLSAHTTHRSAHGGCRTHTLDLIPSEAPFSHLE